MSLFAEYQPGEGGARFDDVVVRIAREVDARGIAQLSAEREGTPLESVLPVAVRETRGDFPHDEHRLFVAMRDERLIGFGRSKWFERAQDADERVAPSGWYLSGVIVATDCRRRGVARALTAARLDDLFCTEREVFYVVNVTNRASQDLHQSFGFKEVTRDFEMPRVSFTGGVGILYRAENEQPA